jgi:hypothetical protein
LNGAPNQRCAIAQWDSLQLRDAHGTVLSVGITPSFDAAAAEREPRVMYGPENGYESFYWMNWCGGPLPGPLHILWTLPGGTTLDWPVDASTDQAGNIISPPCDDAGRQSKFQISQTF